MKFFKNKNFTMKDQKSQQKIQSKSKTSLVESSFIKEKISSILSKMKFIKEAHQREKYQLLEEFKYYQNWVFGMVDLMAIRIREEDKKNRFCKKESNRLKNDISILRQINQEFSIKLNSQKSLSHISYDMNSSTKNFESRFSSQNDKENSRDLINTFGSGSDHSKSKNATFGRKVQKPIFLKEKNDSSIQSERMCKLKQRSKELANQRRLRDLNLYYDKEKNFQDFDFSKKHMKSECYESQNPKRGLEAPSPKPFAEYEPNHNKMGKYSSSPKRHFQAKNVTDRGPRHHMKYQESHNLTERSIESDISEDEKSQFVLREKSQLEGGSNKYEIHHIRFHTGSICEGGQLKPINEMDSLDSISDQL